MSDDDYEVRLNLLFRSRYQSKIERAKEIAREFDEYKAGHRKLCNVQIYLGS
jgi:hypothetical protein